MGLDIRHVLNISMKTHKLTHIPENLHRRVNKDMLAICHNHKSNMHPFHKLSQFIINNEPVGMSCI